MYFLALAADYDGTLALRGSVDPATLDALGRFKSSGRKLILVTGRELSELVKIFPDIGVFDRVVAENGAVIFDPASQVSRRIAAPPSAELVTRLVEAGVEPISVGQSVIAIWEPHQDIALRLIQELELELAIIFNKGAVMILPAGVNKATGLHEALVELDLSRHATIGVGDAENDHSFLSLCGCSAAVANALPSLKGEVDLVLERDHGAGVQDLVHKVLNDEAGLLHLERHGLSLGSDKSGRTVHIGPQGGNVLIVGPSSCGKSTFVAALLEQMADRQFEFCVFDPEGDYKLTRSAVPVGSSENKPDHHEVLTLIEKAAVNVVVHLHAMPPWERNDLLMRLWPKITELRARSGRPHWLIIDEAHQFASAAASENLALLTEADPPVILVTVDPGLLSPQALKSVGTLCAFGPGAFELIDKFCKRLQLPLPVSPSQAQDARMLVWHPGGSMPPQEVLPPSPRQPHMRHAGKYAEGDVGQGRSFYFRGKDRRLNTPAKNLFEFLKIADTLDDCVWLFHLRSGDYARWFRDVIRDEVLAELAEALQRDPGITAEKTRHSIGDAILARYAAPVQAS